MPADDRIYRVRKWAGAPGDAALTDGRAWAAIPGIFLRHHMGMPPAHFPRTEVKMAADASSILLLFTVQDRYVRAVAARHQQSVCGDSCVEFFFAPGPDSDRGYFNLEINCGGTLLFHFHPTAERGVFNELPLSACEAVRCHSSLPPIIDPEITEPLTWRMAVRVPLAILSGYAPLVPPAAGAVWRGNFYKCADRTSHPHWLTWAPVAAPKPDFHLPQFFGTLVFV